MLFFSPALVIVISQIQPASPEHCCISIKDHIPPILSSLHWVPLKSRLDLKNLLHACKAHKNKIHHILKRS